jgi:hypothetical protein
MTRKFQKLIFISIYCILTSVYSFAQRDFRPGYIISNSSDTIIGYILYKSFDAYNDCTFKAAIENKDNHYKPGEIKAFRFSDGKFFISKEIPSETGLQLVFAEFLIQGKANIYYYQDGLEHFYIETDKDKITELSDLTPGEDRLHLKNGFYKGKLRYMLSNCPAIYPEIDRVNLNSSDLIKLAKDYHEKVCTSEQCIIFERKDKTVNVNIGFLAGASLNRFYFNNGVKTNYAFGEFIGFNINFENIFFSLEHNSLQLGLLVEKVSACSISSPIKNIRYNRSGNINKIDSIDLNAIVLKLPVTFN